MVACCDGILTAWTWLVLRAGMFSMWRCLGYRMAVRARTGRDGARSSRHPRSSGNQPTWCGGSWTQMMVAAAL